MAYANLIDSILDDNRQFAVKTASAGLRDDVLDTRPGPSRHYAAATRTSSADSEGSLTEASMVIASRHQASKTASAKLTIPQLIKFATELPAALRNLSVPQKQKIASAAKQTKDAADRLQRLANKTAAQMKQDGAVKLADYLDATKVPMWAKQARADVAHLIALYQTVNPQAAKTASADPVAERSMSDKEVGNYIHKLLNEGVTPKDVAAKLAKIADLQGYSHGFAAEKLKNDAGVVGYAYMEPGGGAMGSCADVYQRQSVKLGGIKAHSVRQITACVDCTHFQKEGSSKRCNLYQRPIVANGAELMPIINHLTASIGKTASMEAKKAELVKQANRESERPVVGVKQASRSSESSFKRNDQKASVRPIPQAKVVAKTAADVFTVKTAHAMHQAGKDLNTIYASAIAKVGAAEARLLVRSFIAGLKGTKAKVALTQIDCTQLKAKLGSSNGIIGAAKCASCTYRNGMHCGLTGGTLLNFPGMKNAKTNHRIAAGAPEDGLGMMKEFEMVDQITPGDIEINKPDFVNIELNGMSKVEL